MEGKRQCRGRQDKTITVALSSGRFSNHPSTAVGASNSILAWSHWLGSKARPLRLPFP